jgi:uncharacterized membrane protein
MNAVAQVLAVLQGLVLVAVGVLEAFFYRSARFFPIFLIKPYDRTSVRLWVVNVGCYNILMGGMCLLGVVLLYTGDAIVGRTLIFAVSSMHVVLGVVLAVTEPKLWRNAVGEAALALLVLLAGLLVL